MPWYERALLPTIIGAAVTIAVIFAAELIDQQIIALRIIMGLTAGIITLQLGDVWEAHARTPRLAKLEEALTDPVLYERLQTIIDANTESHRLAAHNHTCEALFRERREQALADATIVMQEIAKGKLRVADPDRQYSLAVDLVGLAKSSVKAVSYRDEDFWRMKAGTRYLEFNRALIARHGTVQRVFVLSEDALISQRSVIETHVAMGIEGHILPPANQQPPDSEDFVVYDDEFVRFAEPLEFEGSAKQATLSVDSTDVARYNRKFSELLLRSVTVNEFYEELDQRSRPTDTQQES